MRVVPTLPSIWACKANLSSKYKRLSSFKNYYKESGTPYPKTLPFCTDNNVPLSANELILQKYMKHTDLFTEIFSSFKFASENHTQRREYCKIFKIPADLDSDNVGYKIRLSGDELRMLHCIYLRNISTYINKGLVKLP